ncbi:SMI1/KNR4 family protein [Kitasatospora sp. NPDC059577]|uniref:SMI1/KNR4 family protein n=1 Tax=Kitasatospora sp. NPDC059577 TaxID=3346873 RepID=UPI00368919F1
MPRTFDLPTELASSLVGPAAAWRFVERFATHLGAPVEATDGCTEEELAAAEQRLGLRLPGALREAYGRFGRRFDLFGGQEQWIPLEDVEVEDGVLVFLAERYWYWAVGIPVAQAVVDDPPLVTDATPGDPVAAVWQPMADRFSAAFVESVLNGNLLCDDMGGMRREMMPGDLERVERELTPMPPFEDGPEEDGCRWYAGPDVLVCVDRTDPDVQLGWICVRAFNRQALDGMCGALRGDWTHTMNY